MNEAIKEIANKYEIIEERISEILAGMKVKNPGKPTKIQLEGFEKVCILIKEGKGVEEAIAIVVAEAKNNSNSTQVETQLGEEGLEKLVLELADQAAETMLSSIANLALIPLEQYQRIKALFISRYQAQIIEQLQNPQYRQQFLALMTGDNEGKLKLLSNTDSTLALLNSGSSSS
ncbi:hypothetical protein [Chroococcus sp. FPU101]|uniref:hypothetical protein n=1 Tax=Chroococcus sp. FPU101 TaxID=1974212 RepID=UPI001A8F03BC|nr:hypothetical protein [Chroococcus sp. FPU101]GFE72211.1 hypothetical protein CFPU101_48210 [Chroococcus sp. FPU101]